MYFTCGDKIYFFENNFVYDSDKGLCYFVPSEEYESLKFVGNKEHSFCREYYFADKAKVNSLGKRVEKFAEWTFRGTTFGLYIEYVIEVPVYIVKLESEANSRLYTFGKAKIELSNTYIIGCAIFRAPYCFYKSILSSDDALRSFLKYCKVRYRTDNGLVSKRVCGSTTDIKRCY